MKKIKHIGIKCFFIVTSLLFAMNSRIYAEEGDSIVNKNFQVELRLNYDFFIHHHFEMRGYDARFPSYEISFQKATYGEKYWQSYFNYPTVGVSLFYSNLANIQSIGSAYAIYPFINYTLNGSKVNSLNFRFGVGLGYLTNKFDRVENYTNTSIGSHFNAAISITFEYRRLIAERFNLAVYAGLFHFSNGASRAPNNGINIMNTGISVAYSLQEPNAYISNEKPAGKHPFKRWDKEMFSYYFAFSYSKKDLDEYMGCGMHWSVYNFSANVLKQISYISKIGLGLDLVYDETDKAILDLDEVSYTDFQIIKPGINVAYELMMGQTSFLFNLGFHVAGAELGEGLFYQKLGLKQNITKHTFAYVALTTHYAWADYLGFGLGFKIDH